MKRWRRVRSKPSPEKVFCYIENRDKDVRECIAEGCWGGTDFMAQCLGDVRTTTLQTIVLEHWRSIVMQRDGACVARLIDPEAGPCRDEWGTIREVFVGELEADYVRLGAHGKRHELSIDHVALCPGHHRGTGAQGGYVWATAHREMLRAYLEE